MGVLSGWISGSNWRRKRVGLPFICQTIALTLLVACGLYFSYEHGGDVLDGAGDIYNRRLESRLCGTMDDDLQDDKAHCPDPARPAGLLAVVLYFLESIYLFLAIAIVCDEFFVPSLEVIAAVGYQRRHRGRHSDGSGRKCAGIGHFLDRNLHRVRYRLRND